MKQQAKGLYYVYSEFFTPMIGKHVRIQLDKHDFIMPLKEVRLAKLADLENAPDKRPGENGKMYTPPVMQLVFQDDETIDIILEDIIDGKVNLDGVTFKFQQTEITFTCVS